MTAVRRALSVGAGLLLTLSAAMIAQLGARHALGETAPARASAAPAAAPAPAPAVQAPGEALTQHASPVASYRLHASLDSAQHRVHGEGTIVWRNASREPAREIFLHLYLNAFKNERTIYMRQRSRGFRGGAPLDDFGWIRVARLSVPAWNADLWAGAEHHTPGDPEDETDIRVPLPRPVEPGAEITLDMAWDARLPSVTLRTGYAGSFHMVAQWFPKIARLEPDGRWAHFPFNRFSEFYADFGAYDVTVDVPDGFLVGATGRLEHETHAAGRVERRFVQEDVHDFAFAAWDQFREITATSADGVALRCLYPSGYDRVAHLELDAVRYGLEHLGAAYGRYPYGTLTIVHPPRGAEEAGGMEYPTLITTGGEWFVPESGARSVEDVTIHELGHQWFYGLVATNEHDHPFLDEGLNSFAEGEAMEARWPGSSAARLPGGLGLSLPALWRAGAAQVEHNEPVAQSAADFASGRDYGALVYARTATILNTLANVHGKDRVLDAIGRYTRRYRFEHPGPEQFLEVMGEALGPDAVAVLRDALFMRGWVDYAIDDVSSSPSTAPLGVFGDPERPAAPPVDERAPAWRGRVLVRRHGTLRFPVDVELMSADGSTQRVPWDGQGATHEIPYAGESKLVGAIVDPDHRILLDDDLLDNAVTVSSSRLGRRVLERGSFAAELALHLLAP